MLTRIPKNDARAHAPRVADLLAADTRAARRLLVAGAAQRAALQAMVTRLEANLTQILAQAAQHLPIAPERLRALVDRELERLRCAHSVTVFVHPDDLHELQAPAVMAARAELEGTLRLAADPNLRRGECWLESDVGQVDARLQTRLRSLTAALLSGLRDE